MAIYRGQQGIAFQGGGNSMFSQLNAAMQRASQERQVEREDNFYNKLNTSGLLGAQSTDFFGSNVTADGNINLGDKEKIKSWKEHYNELAPTGRDIKRTFGTNVSRQELETLFKNKSAERDMEVYNAIVRKMEEKGTSDIYKVVPKKNEAGGEAFEQWYNSITNDEVRKKIREFGYLPGQEEMAFTPDFIEKRRARGKGLSEIAVPAAIGTAGAISAFNALAPNIKDSGAVKWVQKRFGYNPGEAREILRAMQTGERPRNLSSKINAKKKLIERLSNQKKKLSARDARRLGQAKRFLKDFEGAQKNWKESSRKILQQANKGRVIGSGLGLLRQVGGYNIGKTLAEQVTDNQLAQEATALGSSVALPKLMDAGAKRAIATWAPRILANAGWIGGPKGRALTGLLSVGLGYGLDKLLSVD